MPTSRPMTEPELAYRAEGLAQLVRILGSDRVIEAPELQAVYDWCLAQNWDASADDLEEYGPVVGIGMVMGDLIAAQIGMDWVWLHDPEYDWSGPALQLRGKAVYCHPVPMIAGRLADRIQIRIDTLIASVTAELLRLRDTADRITT